VNANGSGEVFADGIGLRHRVHALMVAAIVRLRDHADGELLGA